MRRLVTLLLSAALCLFCLSGCRKSPEGKWETVKYEFDGTVMTENDNQAVRELMQFELEDGGKGKAYVSGEESDLSWTSDKEGDITLNFSGRRADGKLSEEGTSMELTIVSGEGIGIKVTLEKAE